MKKRKNLERGKGGMEVEGKRRKRRHPSGGKRERRGGRLSMAKAGKAFHVFTLFFTSSKKEKGKEKEEGEFGTGKKVPEVEKRRKELSGKKRGSLFFPR